MVTPLLYLDYDGCLHADDVRLVRGRPVIYVDRKPSDQPLFAHAPLLEHILGLFPEVRIVLCTSWVRVFKFSRARSYLPTGLQARVVGATYHSQMRFESIEFEALSRYQTIIADAHRRKCDNWVALDNDTDGWPLETRSRVVAPTDPILALAQPGIADELTIKLAQLCER